MGDGGGTGARKNISSALSLLSLRLPSLPWLRAATPPRHPAVAARPAATPRSMPIYINTCLSLLVFSVNPRHLDTRLGIVVTLFL